jgi:predicted dehydrogenase
METTLFPQFNIGILGATGYIGAPYRKEIRESGQARIVALCARRKEPLQAAGKEDGALLCTDNWRQVIEHPEVDLVIIGTPDALHHQALMECAAAGKHVFCEKPIGVNAVEAREMWEAYKNLGHLAHYVPFWTRYVSVFARARTLVREGFLGEIKAVFYRWLNPRPASMPLTWRDDPALSAGGSIADVGSHAYDTVRWILGEEAKRVLCHADVITPSKADLGPINLTDALEWGQSHRLDEASSSKGGTPDYASTSWEFESGITGSLVVSHATYLRKGLAPELEFHGTNASLAVDRITGNLTLSKSDGSCEVIENVPDEGFGNRFKKHVFPALRNQIDANPDPNHPNLEDGWRTQVFTDAVTKSGATAGWVALKDIEDA